MSRRVEAGLRNYRLHFIREEDYAYPGENVDYKMYSNVINEFNWSAEPGNEPRRGLGDADPIDFSRTSELHEFVINYDLMKWFTDGGDPYDAAYDGLARDEDNLLPNSHSIVVREEKVGSVSPESTVNGSEGRPTRIYSVGNGGLIGECVIHGDTSDGGPNTVELTYNCQKGRSYQIDQPTEPTTLEIISDNENDNVEVTIFDDDDTSEQLTLDGTTLVTGTEQFDNIDGVYFHDEYEGKVTISENEGVALAEFHGYGSYDDVESDRGIPIPDSVEDEVSEEPQLFAGDTIYRGEDPFIYEIVESELTVDNDIEEIETATVLGMSLHEGNREIEHEATMFGENASHKMLVDSLTGTEEDQEWEMTGGEIVLDDSILMEPGERAAEEGQAVMTIENVFTSKGITINE